MEGHQERGSRQRRWWITATTERPELSTYHCRKHLSNLSLISLSSLPLGETTDLLTSDMCYGPLSLLGNQMEDKEFNPFKIQSHCRRNRKKRNPACYKLNRNVERTQAKKTGQSRRQKRANIHGTGTEVHETTCQILGVIAEGTETFFRDMDAG